jgi:hypothetical protein
MHDDDSDLRRNDGIDAARDLERQAKALFDASVERLDGRTRSKLTQARYAALEELQASRAQPLRRYWAPSAGLAAAAVLAVVIGINLRPDGAARDTGLPLEDFDIVADADNIDMLQDVEFYDWVGDQGIGDSG